VADHWLAIIAIALGVVAIIMAAPPLFQMFFGRTRLRFEADDFTGPDGRILVLAIKNSPITSKFLRLIGVERETGNISAFFDVQEIGTGRIIARSISGLMQTTHLREMGLEARTIPGFTVGLTIIGTRNGQAHVVAAKSDPIPISAGHYAAHIAVIRGQDVYRIDQSFRVGSADHETIWYERNVVSTRQ